MQLDNNKKKYYINTMYFCLNVFRIYKLKIKFTL